MGSTHHTLPIGLPHTQHIITTRLFGFTFWPPPRTASLVAPVVDTARRLAGALASGFTLEPRRNRLRTVCAKLCSDSEVDAPGGTRCELRRRSDRHHRLVTPTTPNLSAAVDLFRVFPVTSRSRSRRRTRRNASHTPHTARHTDAAASSVMWPDTQLLDVDDWPSALVHAGHRPPQSTPSSLPFLMPSAQLDSAAGRNVHDPSGDVSKPESHWLQLLPM